MNKTLVTILKLLAVAGLMWWVFASINFDDRLVYRERLQGDDTKIVKEETIEIVGSWKNDPLVYRYAGEAADQTERTIALGVQDDGLLLSVTPGFLTYWHNLDPWLFALGAFCYFLTVMIAGLRWWWLLRVNGTDVSPLETLRFTWIGVFFNTVMPGATGGDLIKALYIMKRCPGHRVQVLVSVAVDRVLGLASLALLGAIVVLFALDRFGWIALAVWGVILGVALLGVLAFSRRLRERIKLKALLERLPHKLSHLLKLVDQAIFFYRDHKRVIGLSLLIGMGNHVVSVLCVVFLGMALDIGVPPLEYFVLVPIINIVSAVPLGPQGWGLGEWAYKSLFGKYAAVHLPDVANASEVMGTRGLALSVLYRLHLTFWSLLGGVFVMFEKDRVTKADIEREEQREADD